MLHWIVLLDGPFGNFQLKIEQSGMSKFVETWVELEVLDQQSYKSFSFFLMHPTSSELE